MGVYLQDGGPESGRHEGAVVVARSCSGAAGRKGRDGIIFLARSLDGCFLFFVFFFILCLLEVGTPSISPLMGPGIWAGACAALQCGFCLLPF